MADYQWNRPTTILYPGGGKRELEYDGLMRLTHLTAKDPGGNMLLDSSYEYDHRGNIVSKQTEHGRYIYGYDVSSRLTSAEHPVLDDENYTYDNIGNRTTASNVDGSINHNANNELTLYGNIEYTYDANGNMTQKKVGTAAVNYDYNAENRLIKVEDDLTNVVIAEYGYDPFGRRLWKDVGGVRTYFFYSDEGLIAEYDATGSELKTYGYQPDSTWTTDPLWLKEHGEYYFYQNDHLGTPQKLVKQNGAVVWSAQYSAFGQADVHVETVTNNFRFPGQYYDAETGLHYNFQRYYSPFTGCFTSPDPLQFAGGDVNLYGYAARNPLNVRDPYGLLIEAVDGVMTPESVAWLKNQLAELAQHPEAMGPATLLLFNLTATVVVYGGAAMTIIGITPRTVDMTVEEEQQALIDATLQHQQQYSHDTNTTPDERKCQPDDFGRECPWHEFKENAVTVYVDLASPHASLGAETLDGNRRIEGWWPDNSSPGAGFVDNDTDYVHGPMKRKRTERYNACKESIAAVDLGIDWFASGRFDLFNIGARNCAGWVCEVLKFAEAVPPVSPPKPKLHTPRFVGCDEPGLLPYHLLPGGQYIPILSDDFDGETFRRLVYRIFY